ncbi:MAG: hypothetical protein DPW09_42500 [Anaerolineae bacterium]|nr:hypothetical protein [Anaerolineae bacterium]
MPPADAYGCASYGEKLDLLGLLSAIFREVFTSQRHTTDDENGVQKLCFWTPTKLFTKEIPGIGPDAPAAMSGQTGLWGKDVCKLL